MTSRRAVALLIVRVASLATLLGACGDRAPAAMWPRAEPPSLAVPLEPSHDAGSAPGPEPSPTPEPAPAPPETPETRHPSGQ